MLSHWSARPLSVRVVSSGHTCDKMVAIASPAMLAKQRGPRKQVQRSEPVEAAIKARQRKRAKKAAAREKTGKSGK